MKRNLEMTTEDMERVIDFLEDIPVEDYGKLNFNYNDYDSDWLRRNKTHRLKIKAVVIGEKRKFNLGGYEKCCCGIMKRVGEDNYHIHNKYHKLWLKQNLV